MENYRKTQQLYKLLGLFKKTHKKQPKNKPLYWSQVAFRYAMVIYLVTQAINAWSTSALLLQYLMMFSVLILLISGIIIFFIYSFTFLKFKLYKNMNFSIMACEDVRQTARYTAILQKSFTQSFLEEKLLELDFQIRTKNARLIPFIIALGFLSSVGSFFIGKISGLQILDIFNFMIFTPKSIQHLAIQNIMTLIASFLLGIFIGVIIVKFQTYKYTYWTELLKLTIQLMEHEKKYKAIQTSNNIDSSNSRNWKKKIITWLQN